MQQDIDLQIRSGYTKLPNFIFGLSLTPVQLSILCALYQHMPNVNPSTIRLARMIGISSRYVTECFIELENKNLIGRSFQKGRRTVYLLHEDYNSFISKKLVKSYPPPPNPSSPLPLNYTTLTPEPQFGTPLNPSSPKQDKKQYKEQEIFLNYEDELLDRMKMADDMKVIIKQLGSKI